MKSQISFANLGNDYIHRMRDQINNSEDKIDLENNFCYTVSKFLIDVFSGEELEVSADDISFDPNSETFYTLSDNLKNQERFREIWQNSDLPNVIKRFAESTYHRYLHLNKHLEKTQKKIRN